MLRVGFDRLSAGLFIIILSVPLFKKKKKKHLGFEIRILRPPSITAVYLPPLPFFLSFYFFLSISFSFIVFVSLLYSSTRPTTSFIIILVARGSGSISETHVRKTHHDVIPRWNFKHISHHESNSNLWRSTQYICIFFFFFKHNVFFLSLKFFRECRRWIEKFYQKKKKKSL